MRAANGLWAALALILLPGESHALREGDCEVCVSFLGRFYQSLKEKNVEFTPNSIEKELLKSCKEAKGKENRLVLFVTRAGRILSGASAHARKFVTRAGRILSGASAHARKFVTHVDCIPQWPQHECYYIGATSDAATKITNEVSKPLSNHIPVDKICEKLKKKDSQICDLKYDKQIDLSTVDLKKLRVKELKKILDDWGETCKGCAEKSDYIRKINELMPQYAPKAASSRTDL